MSIRTERMARLVQREVAELLNNEFFEASQSLVTVTGVRVTKDLGIAYVDVSVLGEDAARRQITFRRLVDITPQVRQALAGRIRHQVRRIPEIKFFLDESQQDVARLEELFDQIREERNDADGPDATDADESVRDA